jgi:putative ABC transport system permease protein
MKKNYIFQFFRKLFKNKISSTINVIGIAVSVASITFILNYVVFECNYDSFHEKSDLIYRVNRTQYKDGAVFAESARTDRELGEVLSDNLPEVLDFTRMVKNRYNLINVDENIFVEKSIFFVDTSFFSIFSCKGIYGNQKKFLRNPNTAVLSKHISEKYFGDIDPVGKEIRNGRQFYTVVGVIDDFPADSHFDFDILLSFHNTLKIPPMRIPWNFCDYYTYMLLDNNASINKVADDSQDLILAKKGRNNAQANIETKYSFTPIGDIHLYSHYNDELKQGNDILNIQILIAVAVFVFLIAAINYNNLFSSVFLYNLKAVSLKKMFGVNKMSMFLEIFIDCLLLVFIGFVFGMVLCNLFFENLNDFILNTHSFQGIHTKPLFWGICIVGIIIFSFLLSVYPFWLSNKVNPLSIFRGKVLGKFGMKQFASFFLSVQFFISFFFLAGTFTVIKQVKYFKDYNSGQKIENTMIIKIPSNSRMLYNRMKVFRAELENVAIVEDISLASAIPGSIVRHIDSYSKSDVNKGKRTVGLVYIDDRYFDFFGVKQMGGNKTRLDEIGDDRNVVLMNESAYRLFNFSKNGSFENEKIVWDKKEHEIVGVVEDFKITSLKFGQEPIVFKLSQKTGFDYCAIRYMPNKLEETLPIVKTKFEDCFHLPFEYTLANEFLENQYLPEIRFGRLFGLFSFVIIVLSLMGIWALSHYNLMKKQKEMAVRKVMGARSLDIIRAAYHDLGISVIVTYILAMPVSFFIMNKWLENYSYKISVGVWFFSIPLITVVVISCITLVFHGWKLIKTSPVYALRYE